MKPAIGLLVAVVCIVLACEAAAKEMILTIKLQDFSGDNVQERMKEAVQGPEDSTGSVVKALKPGRVIFSQSLNVTEGKKLMETIVVGDTTIEFRCQFGKLVQDKVMAGLDFSMTKSRDDSETPIVESIHSVTTTYELKLGEKRYLGGGCTDTSARLLSLELAEPEKE